MKVLKIMKELQRDMSNCSMSELLDSLNKSGWVLYRHNFHVNQEGIISGWVRMCKNGLNLQFIFSNATGKLITICE